jgi:multimeric flavodoxin WrbA
MKKVTAFIGSKAKKATYQAVQEFEKSLKVHADIDFEYVFLSDYRIEFCDSCLQCFMKGEEHCPLKDDRDKLIEKMERSDGVVFATPNYAFQVSGRMKNFIDRLAFNYHRPRYFDKAFTGIVTQGVIGGSGIVKYLHTTGESMGFHASRGCCVTTLRPLTKKQQKSLSEEVGKAALRFHKELMRPAPVPSFFRLMLFRLARTAIKHADKKVKDYQHYKEKGWFESEYYYPTSLGIVKGLAGGLFDFLGHQLVKRQ